MNKFNKLYNLILESIISLNKASRRAMLLKRYSNYPDYIRDWSLFLDKLNNNKVADLLCKFVVNGSLILQSSKNIDKVIKILELNPSIDIQKINCSIDLFIYNYSDSIAKHLLKQIAKSAKTLDKIPQFSLKKLYDHGVVIYRVEDSKEGMNAVRKIIDLQYGEDTNPWCLVTRPMEQAQKYWLRYDAYPKHIAFQNGKVFAFCANRDPEILWWNMQNKPSKTLFTPDFQQINIELLYKWTPEELRLKFIKAKELVYNEKIGRYDCNEDIRIMDWDLIDGHLPVPFGVIKSDFICYGCYSLKDLTNSPTEVYGKFNCADCKYLTSFVGGPTKVHGDFICYSDEKITSLVGGPLRVGGKYWCYHCTNLKNFLGAAKFVGGDFQASLCFNLLSLIGSPKKVAGDFDIRYCRNVINLLGGPKEVGGNFVINYSDIESLKGGPEKLGGEILCFDCDKLVITKEDLHKYLIENLSRSY